MAHVLGASCVLTMLFGGMESIDWKNSMVSKKLSNIAMIIFDFITAVAVWFQSVADESSSLLPFMMPCWPGGADYGPPEFEIDDTSSSSSRRGTSKIKSSLRVNNFVKSAANCDHDCTVCLSEFSDNDSVYELPQCKHIFHKACLNEWLQTNRTTCPLCRSSLQPAQCTAAVPGEMSATSDHYFDHRY
ncbi:hypothetical protein MPTK1_4g15970 [Marchantia polymorpha subsp. ruderalis]|uniref:RING-type domain-containing protein n=2 Tax=Marchantia polymorpha TaxID=3197 RepID=A0AAF6BAD0_MARPO|nr:hypothetical protein MARPO_0054s0062 [Marchantia polymorpha]BBN08964.1 hypothetical protein Mp_4g15970 [Marchantia polymorpha subsp. ruderalis]|eukprot:PTQ37950.1 hypothetical protein MARPO_0054s0062 [Marchantia polymorpha]